MRTIPKTHMLGSGDRSGSRESSNCWKCALKGGSIPQRSYPHPLEQENNSCCGARGHLTQRQKKKKKEKAKRGM